MNNTSPAFSVFKITHRIMFFGQLIFLGVLFFLVYRKEVTPPLAAQDKPLQVIAIVFSAIAFFAGNELFKRRLVAIKGNTGLPVRKQYDKYRSACIVQWALLEGAVLFCGICFFLVGNYSFIALAVLLALLFMLQMPDKNKMALQLGLSAGDVDEL